MRPEREGSAPHERRCPACGWPAATIWVHGHGQCAHCGTNVEPCCAGEQAQLGAALAHHPSPPEPGSPPPGVDGSGTGGSIHPGAVG